MIDDPVLRGAFFTATGAVGLVVGSFLNVVIHRVPLGASVVSPPSACPRCGHAIRWYHNVPVAGWLVLRGRCADCGEPISPRYPAVEAANALLWLAAAARFGLSWQTLVLLPFLSGMLALFFTDWDHQLLPDRITWPLVVLGLAVAPWNGRLGLGFLRPVHDAWTWRLGAAVLGAGLGYGLFWLIGTAWLVLLKKDALGGGDLKLMAVVGAFLGPPGVLLTTFGGSVGGTLLAAPFLLRGRWSMSRELPFGCFLCPAAAAAAYYGIEALGWYLGLLS